MARPRAGVVKGQPRRAKRFAGLTTEGERPAGAGDPPSPGRASPGSSRRPWTPRPRLARGAHGPPSRGTRGTTESRSREGSATARERFAGLTTRANAQPPFMRRVAPGGSRVTPSWRSTVAWRASPWSRGCPRELLRGRKAPTAPSSEATNAKSWRPTSSPASGSATTPSSTTAYVGANFGGARTDDPRTGDARPRRRLTFDSGVDAGTDIRPERRDRGNAGPAEQSRNLLTPDDDGAGRAGSWSPRWVPGPSAGS